MVDIQSKEVIDKISEDLKVQPAMQIPRALGKDIQLVYGVNPEQVNKTRHLTRADSGGTTIMTTHATKRTFLTGFIISYAKDVNSTSAFTSLAYTQKGGASADLIKIQYEPVTAGDDTIINHFNPIELEKSSTIVITNSTAVASIDDSTTLFFYEVDPQ